MLLPACKLSTFKLLVVGRFAKGEGFFWLDDLDGILLARRESLAVLLKNRRMMPAMKKSTVLFKDTIGKMTGEIKLGYGSKLKCSD